MPIQSEQLKPSKRFKSFHFNKNDVIIIDTKSKQPTLRRIRKISINNQTDEAEIPTNSINIHSLDSNESTPVHPLLAMRTTPVNKSQVSKDPPTESNHSPHIWPEDNVNMAQAKKQVLSRETLLQSTGFLSTDNIIKYIDNISTGSVQIASMPRNPLMDPGETATMKSTRKSKKESTTKHKYSNMWHIDIGFGPCTSIGGIRYTLMAIDKFSRKKLIYGLKNLK